MKAPSKKVTSREKTMIGILLILLVGVAYFYGLYTPTKNQLAQLENERYTLETELTVLQAEQAEILRLQKELEEIQAKAAAGGVQTSVQDYDNFNAMMDQLNLLMKGTTEYSMNFGTVDMSSSIVRRPVTMNFRCNSYDAAKEILKQLATGPFRCQISDLSITGNNGQNTNVGINKGPVTVAVTITYFEMKVNK